MHFRSLHLQPRIRQPTLGSRRFNSFFSQIIRMSSFWRQVGMNYIEYSGVCARVVRQALKPELRTEALKREDSIMKRTKWEDGKPIKVEQKPAS